MMTLVAALAALASVQAFRLEIDDDTRTARIVGADGERREVCLLSPEDYTALTGRVDRAWKEANATERGREKLHGKIVSRRYTARENTTTYADGYRHIETLEPKTATVMYNFAEAHKTAAAKAADPRYSEAQRRYRELIEAWKKKTPREVTVEHNAVTGEDVVK